MHKTQKKYWLNTYFPYYRFKGIFESKEFAVFALRQLIRLSVDFWSRHQDLAEVHFFRPFEEKWWSQRYIHDPNFTAFTILQLDISAERQQKWYGQMETSKPPVEIPLKVKETSHEES